VCNGFDDNCAGGIDEGNPGGGAACSSGQLGVCSAGTRTCSGGSLVCVRNTNPPPSDATRWTTTATGRSTSRTPISMRAAPRAWGCARARVE